MLPACRGRSCDAALFKKAFEDTLHGGNGLCKIDRLKLNESEMGAFVMFLVACDNAVFGDPKKGLVEKSCDTSGSAAAWAFVRG